MKVRFFKIAQMELDSAIEYYNTERSGLGYEFLWEVFAAIDRIKEFPEAWQSFYRGTRRCLMRRFPYGVIYKHVDNCIMITAIANLHREPGYFVERISGNNS